MAWRVVLAKSAERQFRRLPPKDRVRIAAAIHGIESNPFSGDVVKLVGEDNVWRRRIGPYRILFEPYLERRIVFIYDIARRTTTTYR